MASAKRKLEKTRATTPGEGRAAKRLTESEQSRIVEKQASLMRRWVKATAEYRAGDCTEQEYRDYCQMLRNQAAVESQEFCPHHGKSGTRRAHAYAAPIRLGVVGCGLAAGAAAADAVSIPSLPVVSEWAYQAGFGPRELPNGVAFFSSRRDARVGLGRRTLHPPRLELR